MVVVLGYGGAQVQKGTISIGQLTEFFILTLQIASAFAFLSSLFVSFAQVLGHAK
jgi:ATP-binding cassette, subfamily B, bacterial AbcA/BmrA